MTQYVLVHRPVNGTSRLVRDQRSVMPTYRHFDLVTGEEKFSVPANIAMAREIRDAYYAWATPERVEAGLATGGRIVMKPWRGGNPFLDGTVNGRPTCAACGLRLVRDDGVRQQGDGSLQCEICDALESALFGSRANAEPGRGESPEQAASR